MVKEVQSSAFFQLCGKFTTGRGSTQRKRPANKRWYKMHLYQKSNSVQDLLPCQQLIVLLQFMNTWHRLMGCIRFK
jgi:hypothetical protein